MIKWLNEKEKFNHSVNEHQNLSRSISQPRYYNGYFLTLEKWQIYKIKNHDVPNSGEFVIFMKYFIIENIDKPFEKKNLTLVSYLKII